LKTLETTKTIDAVALVAESTDLVPVAGREVAYQNCIFPGCPNIASRSDQKCARHSRLHLLTKHVVEEVEEKLKTFSPEAADLVLEAARNGAAQGDHKAAAWILVHAGVVKPVAPEPRGSGATNGLTVHVGIILPGLPGAVEE
jgi:hypothetical protein